MASGYGTPGMIAQRDRSTVPKMGRKSSWEVIRLLGGRAFSVVSQTWRAMAVLEFSIDRGFGRLDRCQLERFDEGSKIGAGGDIEIYYI